MQSKHGKIVPLPHPYQLFDIPLTIATEHVVVPDNDVTHADHPNNKTLVEFMRTLLGKLIRKRNNRKHVNVLLREQFNALVDRCQKLNRSPFRGNDFLRMRIKCYNNAAPLIPFRTKHDFSDNFLVRTMYSVECANCDDRLCVAYNLAH